ncbi:MAG: hypothetical protein FJ088_00670 [Deltaproteobacteria bacterium]|nr:hypothetical protein [Deltaproteobacteria bacterium]
MFVPVWIVFFLTGLAMAAAVLYWSVKTRQFDEQERAKHLPFAGMALEELNEKPPVIFGRSFYGILAIFFCGLIIIGIAVFAIFSA